MDKKLTFAEFAAVSKDEWLEFVAKDPKSASLADKLIANIGGINVPAYASKEDLSKIPYTSTPEVTWQLPASWKIATLFDPQFTSQNQLDGVDALWLKQAPSSAAQLHAGSISLYHLHGPSFRGLSGLNLIKDLGLTPASINLLDGDNIDDTASLLPALNGLKTKRVIAERVIAIRVAAGIEGLTDALRSFQQFANSFESNGYALKSLLDAVQFIFTPGPSFYFEIGRLRAFRVLLTKLIFQLDPNFNQALSIPFVCNIDPAIATQDANQALLHQTTQVTAAVLGGSSLIVVHPTAEGNSDLYHRMARNTQLILKHESHLDRVIRSCSRRLLHRGSNASNCPGCLASI